MLPVQVVRDQERMVTVVVTDSARIRRKKSRESREQHGQLEHDRKKAGTLKKFTGLHAAFTGRNPHVRFGEGEGSLAVHNERVERRKRDIRDILD